LEFITAFFGCLYAGVVAVPVYPPRRNQNLSRLLSIVSNAGAKIALTTSSIRENLIRRWQNQPDLARLKLIATDTLATDHREFVPKSFTTESLAFLQYTSGSTGTPKGVMVSHGNIFHNEEMMKVAFQHNERIVMVGWLPLFHDMGLILNAIQPLYLGGTSIMMSPTAFVQKPYRWLKAISKYRATTSGGPNFAYDLCVNKIRSEELAELDLSSWDLAFNGAEPLRAETLERFSHKFAACGFRANVFYPCYGMAEATLFATGGDKHQQPVMQRFLTEELERKLVVKSEISSKESRVLVGCGRLYANTKAIIVNPESLTRCETGQVGEIWLSGGSITKGYWNRTEETQATFQAYLRDTGEGPFLRTGDLGFIDNEELFITGRLKDLIIIRGRNHYPQDIEITVEKSHPALRENSSAAFAVEAGTEEGLVVTCEVERTYLRKLNLDEIVREIKVAILTEHELTLHGVVLLKTGSIPKTSSGKIQRSACKTGFLENNLNNVVGEWREHPQKITKKSSYVAPRTSGEKIIVHIFEEVLGIENVGIHDNFFDLGGHSLLATQLISRLRQGFRVEISLRDVLESPTIGQLDRAITQLEASNSGTASIVDLPTIVPTPENYYRPFPLTDIQQAYWLGRNSNFDLGNIATHIYIELDCALLNLPQLNQAWQKLIEHHDMLRAVVLESGQQKVLEQVPTYEIEVLDLQSSSSKTSQQSLETIRRQMSHEVLPAEQWPLFDIRATKLNQKQTRLHLSFDALIVDAWSIMLLIQQWQQLYRHPLTLLPPLEITFQDYIKTERDLKETPQYKQSQEYWFNRNLPPAPELPFAVNLSSIDKPKFERHSSQLNSSQWQQLKRMAANANLTPSAVLLSAFADILTYWSQSPKFTINLTLFNRLPLHSQINQLVGDFTSSILLEVNNNVADTFISRAKKLQQQLWQDLEHRDVSGVEVQRELRRRYGNIQPMGVVFTSTLGLNSLIEDTSLNSIGKLVYSITQTPQVWLDHQIFEEEGALVFNWDVVADLFPIGLIEEMFAAYCSCLERLASLEDVGHTIRRQFLPSNQLARQSEINSTNASISQETLHGLFQQQVAINSQSLAVISPEKNLTYQELSELAHKLGYRLQQLGATSNTLVAIVMEKGWEQIVAVLGILISGAAYLPIDPELPPERQSYLLLQGKVKLVLTQPKLKPNLFLPTGINCLTIKKDDLKAAPLNAIESVQNPTHLAYVIYTSGSTGFPKGVAIDHRGAVNTILDINQRFNVGCKDRVLALSALNFDLSVYDIFGILAAGGAIVIPEPELSRRNDPAKWRELISTHRVTIWNTVPALMQMLVTYLEGQTENRVENLRLTLLSGDWLPVGLPAQIKYWCPKVEVISLGGATEASIWSIMYPITRVESSWKSIPYGKPMVNQHFYVLDRFMETRPTWVSGELYIGGIGLALGYWQDEERTNRSFVNHPVTGERLYRTGDLGRYLPSGDIEFLGREDFQVKVNGYRIELGEVEAALRQYPLVKEAVVNLNNNSLVAYIVAKNDALDSFETGQHERLLSVEINEYLKQKLPKYMVPKKYLLLEAFPLTPNGKIDRKALPALTTDKSNSESTYVAPRNSVEKQLARMWSEVIGVSQVGIYDNFFKLGGDSLKATRVIVRIRETFHLEFPLKDFFEEPTVKNVAEYLKLASRLLKKSQNSDKNKERISI
jgi:amino acid adenylation domain-containing protein